MALSRSLVRKPDASSLMNALDARTVEGVLQRPGPRDSLVCLACAHGCVLPEGARGSCGVRRNEQGRLKVPYGYVARKYVRPVETNTIFHVLPGALALTFGMFGCDLRCPYCHNARISQALRDGNASDGPIDVVPEELVAEARAAGAAVLCAAYNEPMIAAEWVHAVFSVAKQQGLTTALISDGNSTPEALAYLRPVADVFRVDLKGFEEEQYRTLGGRLAPVLASIAEAKRLGYWVEVVTLVVPGLNAALTGLRKLAVELQRIDPEMPWHVNAFVPRYRMGDRPRPSPHFLMNVAGAAYARGSSFVYVGNTVEAAGLAHTRCPECQLLLIERRDYRTLSCRIEGARCPRCSRAIPGLS